MSDEPFVYKLKNAHAHLQGAINCINQALMMPACKTWEPKHRSLLKSTRTQLTRHKTILKSLLPAATDVSYMPVEFALEVLADVKGELEEIRAAQDNTDSPLDPQAG